MFVEKSKQRKAVEKSIELKLKTIMDNERKVKLLMEFLTNVHEIFTDTKELIGNNFLEDKSPCYFSFIIDNFFVFDVVYKTKKTIMMLQRPLILVIRTKFLKQNSKQKSEKSEEKGNKELIKSPAKRDKVETIDFSE